MEESLYETEVVYTYEEYKKYNIKLKMRTKPIYALLFFTWALAVILGIRNFETIFGMVVIPSLTVLAYVVLLVLLIGLNGKREWKSNKNIQNKAIAYKFFEDAMEISDKDNTAKIKYADLNRIIETKTNFYLMDSLYMGRLILKGNCSPELQAFIQQLMARVNIKKGKVK